MKELKLTKEPLNELSDSYAYACRRNRSFSECRDRGYCHSTYDRDEEDEELSEIIAEGFNEKYYHIPYRDSNEGYTHMLDFTETISNEKLKIRMFNVLNGRRKNEF